MRMKRFMKRIVSTSLAVLVAVTAIPFPSAVQATSDDFPDEVYFPIQVLDFRKDELLFEYPSDLNSYFDFGNLNYYNKGNGKGLVEDKLGDDGLPVYKKETVEMMSLGVLKALKNTSWTNIMQRPNRTLGEGDYNDLNMRKYIKNGTTKNRPKVVIMDGTQNSNTTDISSSWQPEAADSGVTYSVQQIKPSETKTYGGIEYTGVCAEAYASDNPTTPIYILRDDGSIVLMSNISVSKTFDLNGSYVVSDDLWRGDGTGSSEENLYSGKIRILMNDVPVEKGSVVRQDFYGKLKVTIEIVADKVPDVTVEAKDQLAVGNILLEPYTEPKWTVDKDTVIADLNNKDRVPGDISSLDLGNVTSSNTNSGNNYPKNNGYPLGNYEDSKAKFDKNPDLGWTHITTCMDYAYFVTKNFFRSNASLNTQYTKYDYLIFHKLDGKKEGTVDYEFAADNQHNWDYYRLIYNPIEKTIRNKLNVGANSTIGEVAGDCGSMFILDDAEKQYSSLDGKINNHNFHFTISSHSRFVYKKGEEQEFYFRGDDDVYVFVNGYLYLDIGGAHTPRDGKVNLDDIAAKHGEDWGIQDGKVVSLDFFYMERHSTESNFYGKMNFKLANDDVSFDMEYDSIPYGFLVDLNYSFKTLRELTTNKNVTFTDDFGNVIGADGFTLADGVSLKNNKLVVTVTDADGNVDASRSTEFTFVDPKNPTEEEKNKVINYFKNVAVVQGETIKITGPQYDTSTKPYSEYDKVAGDTVNEKSIKFRTNVTYDAWMDGAQKPTKTKESKDKTVTVLTGSAKLCVAQTDNEKKQLADYGKFTIDRDGDYELSDTDEAIYEKVADSTTKATYKYVSKTENKDKAGAYHYVNNPDEIGITEVSLDELPMGYYTIKLDPSVLTSYRLYINDEEVPQTGYDSTKEKEVGVIWINEAGVPELTLKFIPEYDWDEKTWTYPDLKFELRAKRKAPDLKDLT